MVWAPDYATLAEMRSYAGIVAADDTTDDAKLARNITAASRAVDDHCNRQFGKVAAPELRTYTAMRYDGYNTIVLTDDLMDLTGVVVTVAGVAYVPARWGPQNAPARGKPWRRAFLPGSLSRAPADVSITAAWGWTAVPEAVKEATLLQGLRFSLRKNSPFGVAGSPELGSELRLLAKVDPDVAVMLRKYVAPGKLG